jgi:hypothetical protein
VSKLGKDKREADIGFMKDENRAFVFNARRCRFF